MLENKLKGTGVALVTPFLKNKSVDFISLEKLINHVINNGVNYLVALGTTAETPTLNEEEKIAILNFVIKINNKRIPIVCGIGGNNTAEVMNNIKQYPLQQVDAILSVSPYYNKPTQAGIIAHFKEINKQTTKPIILYNVPGRTGSNMNATTTLQLANECENIIAIKEASGNMVQCMDLIKDKPAHFSVLSGDDNLAMAQIACGFDGVISVAANCYPKLFCEMIQHSLKHDFIKAQLLHYKLLSGIDLLFTEGNPSGVKCALAELGLIENELRLPIVPVSIETQTQIKNFIKNL